MRRLLTLLSLLAAVASAACLPVAAPPTAQSIAAEKATARKVEQRFSQQRKILRNEYPSLQAYVDGIAARINTARPGKAPVRVNLLAETSVNAFTPGGDTVFIHGGLIAALENEAQFAMVLAHEIAHIDRGHVQQGKQAAGMGQIVGAIAAIGAASAGIDPRIAQQGAGMAVRAGVSSFNRDQERDADRTGIIYAQAAGYDPRAASQAFAVLNRIGGGPSGAAALFASHPLSGERLQTLSSFAQTAPPGGEVAQARYLQQTDEIRRQVATVLAQTGKARSGTAQQVGRVLNMR